MINKIKEMFSENDDLVIRKVKINPFHSIYVIFFDTLVNQDKINEYKKEDWLKKDKKTEKMEAVKEMSLTVTKNKSIWNKIKKFIKNIFNK